MPASDQVGGRLQQSIPYCLYFGIVTPCYTLASSYWIIRFR